MRFGDWILVAVGGAVGGFGFVILLGGILAMEEPGNQGAGHMFGIVSLGLVPLLAGAYTVRHALVSGQRTRREAVERSILSLAAESGGRLFPADVASATPLTLDESKETLDALHLAGHCKMELDADGGLVYLFRKPTTASSQGQG